MWNGRGFFFLHFSRFQICRSKVKVKVTQVQNFGMNGNTSSQGMCMLLDMNALHLIDQKLRQILTF